MNKVMGVTSYAILNDRGNVIFLTDSILKVHDFLSASIRKFFAYCFWENNDTEESLNATGLYIHV